MSIVELGSLVEQKALANNCNIPIDSIYISNMLEEVDSLIKWPVLMRFWEGICAEMNFDA